MEGVILLGLIGTGMLINNKKENKEEETNTIIKNISTNPTVNNYNKLDNVKNNKYEITNNNIKDNNIKDNINHNIEDNNLIYSNSLDNFIEKDDFLKNDQGIGVVPYYRGSAPPTIDMNNISKLESHQGGYIAVNKQQKKEVGQFFEPVKENIYGSYFVGASSDKERYVTSKLKNNELPFQQQQVKKIDTKSYYNRVIADEIAKTQSIEHTRTLNNPKLTYEQPLLAGKGIYKRGIQGKVMKYGAPKEFKSGPHRNLAGVTNVHAATQRPTVILSNTNRYLLNEPLMGSAGPLTGVSCAESRPLFKNTSRQQLKTDTNRNVQGPQSIINYEKLGYEAYPNERQVTSERTHILNANYHVPGNTIGLQDDVKNTIKQTTINSKNNGFIGTNYQEHTMGLQDNMKTTLKETAITKNAMGNAGTYINENKSREAYENANTNHTKEILSKMRKPTQVGVFNPADKNFVKMTTNKHENDYFTQQIKGPNKIYQELPQEYKEQYTTKKNTLKDTELLLEQINPDLLNAFNNNPYTKSLHSYNY
jgi:hypothetical protein